MTGTAAPHTLSARLAADADMSAAIAALVAAGIPPGAISVTPGAAPSGAEGGYLCRLVVLIVLWSIPGGAAGAALGAALALAGIGPDGTSGAIVQVVSWAIMGHLLAGMWAGYVVLADRSHREMAPDRQPGTGTLVTVRCRDGAEMEAAARVLGIHDTYRI